MEAGVAMNEALRRDGILNRISHRVAARLIRNVHYLLSLLIISIHSATSNGWSVQEVKPRYDVERRTVLNRPLLKQNGRAGIVRAS